MPESRILIVDDNPGIITLVQEILASKHYEVLVASNGEDGLKQLRAAQLAGHPVDAVLLDVMLPGLDGFHILKQLKADADLNQVPVLLVTGVGETRNKAQGLELGADDYITKPFDSQELLARLHAVLRIRHTEQVLRQRNQELAALDEINRRVSASLDLDQVLTAALEGLERLVEAAMLAIVLYDDEEGEWVVRTSRGPEGAWLEGRIAPVTQDAAAQALRERRSVLQSAVDNSFWSEVLSISPLDLLYVPLMMHDEPIGLLTVVGHAGTLDSQNLPVLERVASSVSVAVENARLYGELTAFAEALQRSQSQLIQAEKMAAIGRLTASIAHEINNPLQAVQNSMHLATHPNLAEAERQRYLGIARQEISHLMGIVRRMLDFYRPASGIAMQVDINKAVEDALAFSNKRLQQANIQLVVRLAPDLPPVQGFANQLTQVYLNIIINAIEALETGGQLWIGTAYHAERDQLVAAFRDNGPGILPTTREHLFEPFFTTKPTGTGLGLAISYGIIERHGGAIEVESTPGAGATFIVRLPRHREEN